MILKIILIFSLFILTNGQNGQADCSSGDICGRYGYCYDVGDEMHCECKFWWEGELCNRQSNSGKQVIILGCLSASLIIIFFGLKYGRMIYIKCKKPEENETKDILQDPKLVNIAIEHVKKATPLSSRIIFIFVIIVAAGTLLAKWSLIKQIHDDIVIKYKNNEPLFYDRRSFCTIFDAVEFNVVTFPIACLLIIICIILTKRTSFMKNKCYGYGAPPIPVDFLSHTDRKFAAVIFAIIADELLGIVQSVLDGSANTSDGVLVKFLLRIFQVLIMGFRFYPILAAVYINSIVTLLCATVYAWLDYSFTIISQGICYPDYYPDYNDYLQNTSNIDLRLYYFGTGSTLIAIELCTDIPRYLCLAYVSVKLPMMLIKKIHNQRRKNLSDEEKMLISLSREENILLRVSHPDSVEMLYVRNLFYSTDERPRSQALIARLIPKFIYEWRDDFRFSVRVLCIYSSIFLLLYFITINAFVSVLPILDIAQSAIQTIVNTMVELVPAIIQAFTDGVETSTANPVALSFPIPNLVKVYICAVVMTVTIMVIQLIVLLVNMRRNLLQAFRGDASEIPRRQRENYVSYATGNFHFAGYFIGYLIWGFILIAVFSSIVCACVGAFIVYGSVRALEQILKAIIPSILLVAFKLFLNKLLAQYIFLQHYGDVLALNNRRSLMIFLYFNFFLDAFLGFISSVLRLITSFIGGIFYMCRLDYASLGRKLELFDSGFTAYCGFIHTECTHRHPIMLVFVSHLFNQLRKQQHIMKQIQSNDLSLQEKDLMQQKKSSRYLRKWRLAAFLVRNPAVVFFRKVFLKRLKPEDRRALNDVDNDDEHDIRRGMALYSRQMAIQRPSFIADIDQTQIITLRF